MKIRINPRKKYLIEEYNKYLNLWYNEYEKSQLCIQHFMEIDDAEYCLDELDKMRDAIRMKQVYSNKMDKIKREYSMLRWIIFE